MLVDGEETPSSLAAKKETPCKQPGVIVPEDNQQPRTDNQQPFCSPKTNNQEPETIEFTFGERYWRVRGLNKNLSYETLRIQLRILRASNQSYHLDTLDLCNAKHRQSFIIQAVSETALSGDILKRDMGNILLQLELKQEELIKKALEPKKAATKILDFSQN